MSGFERGEMEARLARRSRPTAFLADARPESQQRAIAEAQCREFELEAVVRGRQFERVLGIA